MIRHSVDLKRRAVQILYQAAKKAMQVRPQVSLENPAI